jgi:F0F1-type ATP synthase assembly protein I
MDPARQARETRIGWRLAGVGLQTSSEVLAGVALGWVVDHYAKTAPWGLLIGGCAGILVAMTSLIRSAWRMNNELEGKRAKGAGSRKATDTQDPTQGDRP